MLLLVVWLVPWLVVWLVLLPVPEFVELIVELLVPFAVVEELVLFVFCDVEVELFVEVPLLAVIPVLCETLVELRSASTSTAPEKDCGQN